MKLNFIDKSLDRQGVSGDNKTLSKIVSDYANIASNWLFLRPYTAHSGTGAGVNPSFTDFVTTKCLQSYDGVTSQNKPFIGEYVGRLLTIPRVNPITLFFSGDYLNSKIVGAFIMHAHTTHRPSGKSSVTIPTLALLDGLAVMLATLSRLSRIQALAMGMLIGLAITPAVIATLWLMGV